MPWRKSSARISRASPGAIGPSVVFLHGTVRPSGEGNRKLTGQARVQLLRDRFEQDPESTTCELRWLVALFGVRLGGTGRWMGESEATPEGWRLMQERDDRGALAY